MNSDTDIYYTISGETEVLYKEKGSKFLAYAYHIENEEEVKERLDTLRKKYYDATHQCFAWRLGYTGENFRAVDDGEPSSTAGKPILGQLISANLTHSLVVVIRYFGGTKLGVSGLITAYKESAALAIESAVIEERTIDVHLNIGFGYLVMNDVMKVIKEMQPNIIDQQFDNDCLITLKIRRSKSRELIERLEKIEGMTIDEI